MSADRRRRRAGAAAGFTLLEVIVALAIAGFAFALLFRAGSSGLFAVDTAGRVSEAVERAQSHLAAVGHEALLPGDSDGDDGGGYHWWLRIHPLAVRREEGQRAEGLTTTTLYDVEVEISWASGGRERSVTLRSERLVTSSNPGS